MIIGVSKVKIKKGGGEITVPEDIYHKIKSLNLRITRLDKK